MINVQRTYSTDQRKRDNTLPHVVFAHDTIKRSFLICGTDCLAHDVNRGDKNMFSSRFSRAITALGANRIAAKHDFFDATVVEVFEKDFKAFQSQILGTTYAVKRKNTAH